MADIEMTKSLVGSWRAVHERTAALIGGLDDDTLGAQSYDTDWTITQVISHMGSGAAIFSLFFDAAAGRGDPPSQDDMKEYWAEWNAKSPRETAISWRERTGELFAQVEGYGDEVLENAGIELWGRHREMFDLFGMRLNEDTLHTWDIAVMLDSQAELDPDGVPWVLGGLGELVGFVGKPVTPLRATVRTTGPDREFVLEVGEHVSLQPGEEGTGEEASEARLELPAAALVRLVYGRLDPEHTPETVQATGVDLDTLRAVFPGM